jgi:hypothetical protein
LVDRVSLRRLTGPAFRTAAGPAADEQTRQRHGVVATAPQATTAS